MSVRRRAKIVCTLGPSVASEGGIRSLVSSGMDVARMNFSHGDHQGHARMYGWVRRAAAESDRSIGILADLQGPKVRLGTFATGSAVWAEGERIAITAEPVEGDHDRVSTTYRGLVGDVGPGDRLLVDDGNITLEVESTGSNEVRCTVLEGGIVSDYKGVAAPGVNLRVDALSPKDLADLAFAVELGVDMVALSFVRRPEDADLVRRALGARGKSIGVLAKIERPEAVEALEDIVSAFDGLLIARGDLGVEIPLERVPLTQKYGIRLARQAGKPVIVATQMLESMITHSRPTRAEVSDVANAVLDGADALMLSAETSVGHHPAAAVATMDRIVRATEADQSEAPPIDVILKARSAALARSATRIASEVDACALVAFTETGATARRLARHRPLTPLLAFTPHPLVRNQLSLSWGIETFVVPTADTTDDMVRQVDAALLGLGRSSPGDRVVVVAGTPPGQPGTTNTVRVHRLGESV